MVGIGVGENQGGTEHEACWNGWYVRRPKLTREVFQWLEAFRFE